MWLEHLLFGARYWHELFGCVWGQVSLGSRNFSLLRYTASAAVKRKSSLTSLRKDNEVKLEEEIKLVCNKKNDRESIVMLWTAISRQRVNENKCKHVKFLWFKDSKYEQREGYKSGRWMPRLLEAMKDVVSCEKLRGTANRFWSGDFRMGQPGWLKTSHCNAERTGGTETSQYP